MLCKMLLRKRHGRGLVSTISSSFNICKPYPFHLYWPIQVWNNYAKPFQGGVFEDHIVLK